MVQQTASATQQQSQTSRKVGEQTSMVRDYTKHLKRAMSEQETGSRAISRAMENIMGLVQNVLESTSVLATRELGHREGDGRDPAGHARVERLDRRSESDGEHAVARVDAAELRSWTASRCRRRPRAAS